MLKKFSDLNNNELYAVLQLRSAVFVVEQHCYYQDLDGKDQRSYHLMAWQNDELLAYARLLPPGLSYAEPSIGRVVLKKQARGRGLGARLMRESIEYCYQLFGRQPVRIGAQFHLKSFYESLGFIAQGDIYDDAGIDHIEMVLY